MSWDGPTTPPFNKQNNVPDYQKMLQNNVISTGWSVQDHYSGSIYSRTKSPLTSTTTRGGLGSSLTYPDTRSSSYQSYRPSKYGLSTTNAYDQSYLNRDFNEMVIEDSVMETNPDGTTGRNVFDYDKYGKASDVFARNGSNSSDIYTRNGTQTADVFSLNEGKASNIYTGSDKYVNYLRPSSDSTSNVEYHSRPGGPPAKDVVYNHTRPGGPSAGNVVYNHSKSNGPSTIDVGYNTSRNSDNLWTSPPKRTTFDLPSAMYKTPVRTRGSKSDALHYEKDKMVSIPSNGYEDKYFSDNDVTSKGSKSRTTSDIFGPSSSMGQWQREKYPPPQDKYSKTSNGGFDNLFKSIDDHDDQKWASVSRAADDIIREKDLMIDKLKMKVMTLEEDNKQFEVKLKHAVMNGEGDGETYKHIQLLIYTSKSQKRLQIFQLWKKKQELKELELKNVELKDAISDLRAKKNSELENLEIKLGATEEEVNQLRSALRKMGPGAEHFQSQFYQLEQEREEWKAKCMEMRQDNSQMKGKLDELQTYLADLPTPEEAVANNTMLQRLQEECEEYKTQISKARQKLMDSKKKLTTRELQIQELESKERQLAEQVSIVTCEIERIKSEGEGAALQRCEEELETVKKENERLATDLEKAKKLLETSQRKARHQDVKHQNEIRIYQERLSHEEDSVEVLRNEGKQKEEQMNKFKKSMKELGNQNQDLMEQLLIVKEQLKKFEYLASDDNMKLQKKFTREMSACYTELQSLVQVCVQRAEGKDPNMSLLLGIKSNPLDVEGGASSEKEVQTIQQWLTKVQELREEIEGLRQLICNKYAEELGNNLSCATQ